MSSKSHKRRRASKGIPLTKIRDFAMRQALIFNGDALGQQAEIPALDDAWNAWSLFLESDGVRLQDRDTAQEYRIFEQAFVAALT